MAWRRGLLDGLRTLAARRRALGGRAGQQPAVRRVLRPALVARAHWAGTALLVPGVGAGDLLRARWCQRLWQSGACGGFAPRSGRRRLCRGAGHLRDAACCCRGHTARGGSALRGVETARGRGRLRHRCGLPALLEAALLQRSRERLPGRELHRLGTHRAPGRARGRAEHLRAVRQAAALPGLPLQRLGPRRRRDDGTPNPRSARLLRRRPGVRAPQPLGAGLSRLRRLAADGRRRPRLRVRCRRWRPQAAPRPHGRESDRAGTLVEGAGVLRPPEGPDAGGARLGAATAAACRAYALRWGGILWWELRRGQQRPLRAGCSCASPTQGCRRRTGRPRQRGSGPCDPAAPHQPQQLHPEQRAFARAAVADGLGSDRRRPRSDLAGCGRKASRRRRPPSVVRGRDLRHGLPRRPCRRAAEARGVSAGAGAWCTATGLAAELRSGSSSCTQ
mmetsp:Transcript_26558/g.72096  ORF Transcript_26558/g.72096 Transcript_26558/m.72096 type:complete len:448 (+) Transcript_26558:625-1968(+)